MFRIVSLVVVVALMSACTSSPLYHQTFMRGQVVGFDGDYVVFCTGTNEGAVLGQEFDAYRYTYVDAVQEGGESYDVEKVGTVTVRQLVNEHFAKGVISSGEVIESDVLFAKSE